jgi:hypothetical protein
VNRSLLQAKGCLVALLVMACLAVVALLFLHGGVWLGEKLLPWLLQLAAVTGVVVLLVFLPLAIKPRTRPYAIRGLGYASLIFGLTLWVLGLTVTYRLWGGVAVLLGLVLLGVGVVPMGMLASLLAGEWFILGQLVVLAVLTYATRWLRRRLRSLPPPRDPKVLELEIIE